MEKSILHLYLIYIIGKNLNITLPIFWEGPLSSPHIRGIAGQIPIGLLWVRSLNPHPLVRVDGYSSSLFVGIFMTRLVGNAQSD